MYDKLNGHQKLPQSFRITINHWEYLNVQIHKSLYVSGEVLNGQPALQQETPIFQQQ